MKNILFVNAWNPLGAELIEWADLIFAMEGVGLSPQPRVRNRS